METEKDGHLAFLDIDIYKKAQMDPCDTGFIENLFIEIFH